MERGADIVQVGHVTVTHRALPLVLITMATKFSVGTVLYCIYYIRFFFRLEI
jgi:hypothetical protein